MVHIEEIFPEPPAAAPAPAPTLSEKANAIFDKLHNASDGKKPRDEGAEAFMKAMLGASGAEDLPALREQLQMVEDELDNEKKKKPTVPSDAREGWWYESEEPLTEPDFARRRVRDIAKQSGNTAAREENWEMALEHYYTAMELSWLLYPGGDEELGTLHANCSMVSLKLSKLSEALDHANSAVRIRPKWAKSHGRLGAALVAAGRLPEAIDAYQTAVKLVGPSKDDEYRQALMRVEADYKRALSGGVSQARFQEALADSQEAYRSKIEAEVAEQVKARKKEVGERVDAHTRAGAATARARVSASIHALGSERVAISLRML